MTDIDEQLRTIKAAAFAATFDRIVWLDAAALAAVFSAIQSDKVHLSAGARCTVVLALWMFGISLLVTLPIPIWRNWYIVRYPGKLAKPTYIVQGVAAVLTGLAVLLTLAGFVSAFP